VKHVYILESLNRPDKRYIGITSDLDRRIKEHNAGKSPHTARYRPWKMAVAVSFDANEKADRFERYLKSGSGSAFAKRHF